MSSNSKIMLIILLGFVLLLMGFGSSERKKPEDEVFILIEGNTIELVEDDAGNYHMKQKVAGQWVYIPYPFEMEEVENGEEDYKKPKKR